MLRFFPVAGLASLAIGAGVCADFYGSAIVRAKSARAAAPLAPAFVLFTSASVSSFVLAVVAIGDAADKKRAR